MKRSFHQRLDPPTGPWTAPVRPGKDVVSKAGGVGKSLEIIVISSCQLTTKIWKAIGPLKVS
jgi:hypothetical protein